MTEKEKTAVGLFSEGRNCSQAVFAAFCEECGLDKKTALRLSSSFGGGMGRMREVCGAVSGMFMAAGLLFGYDSADNNAEKAAHYARIQKMAQQFKDKHGSIICRELLEGVKTSKGFVPEERTAEYYKKRPCAAYVAEAAKILEQIIEEENGN